MLIDAFLPDYDVVERHSISVRVPAERVYAALRSADLASPVVKLLMGIRTLPYGDWGELRKAMKRPFRLGDFGGKGFSVLAETPGRELLIGLAGAFWSPRAKLRPVDSANFTETPPPGTARAAWNFAVEPEDGGCRLSTETRVLCADAGSRRRFRAYWMFVRPGSGLIRRAMLRAIKRQAELSS